MVAAGHRAVCSISSSASDAERFAPRPRHRPGLRRRLRRAPATPASRCSPIAAASPPEEIAVDGPHSDHSADRLQRLLRLRENRHILTAMVNYVEAALAPLRNDGQIKLYGAGGFRRHAPRRPAGRRVPRRGRGDHRARPADRARSTASSSTSPCAHGALPATLGYKGYMKSTCISINHVVCHGIPSDKPLARRRHRQHRRDADRRRLARRFQPHVQGRRGQARRRAAGRGHLRGDDARHRRRSRPGATTGDIGHAIQDYAERERCSVVRDFCGHGVGRLFHDAPNILHYGSPGEGVALKPGMIFTVEPMINLGRPHVKVLADGWTAVTRDRSLSAQFEHTVGVTETGCEIFTLSPKHAAAPPAAAHERASRTTAAPGAGVPHFHGHRERLQERFRESGARGARRLRAARAAALPGDPARATPSRSPRRCSTRFGSFAEVLAAPEARLDRSRRRRRRPSPITSSSMQAAAQRFARDAGHASGRSSISWSAVIDYCRGGDGLRDRSSSSASSSSTRRTR